MRVFRELVLGCSLSLIFTACGGAQRSEPVVQGEATPEDDVGALLNVAARLTEGRVLKACGVARLGQIPSERRSYIAPSLAHLPVSVFDAMHLNAFISVRLDTEVDPQSFFLYRTHGSHEDIEQALLAQSLISIRLPGGRENECTESDCDLFELMRLDADWVDEHTLRLRREADDQEAVAMHASSSLSCEQVASVDPEALFVQVTQGHGEEPTTVQRIRLVVEGIQNDYRIGGATEWVNPQVLTDASIRGEQERLARVEAISSQMRSDGPGMLPVADVDVSDYTQFRAQIGLRQRPASARPGEVIELFRRRVRARPQDVGALMMLLQMLADATQWEEALEVVRGVEAALPPEMSSALASTARQIAFRANEEDWQTRLLRDGIGTDSNIRELMGSIRVVEDFIDDKHTSYVNAEDLVHADFAIRDSASPMRRARLATPERFPKDGLIGALFALINPGEPGADAEDNRGLVIRVRGRSLTPRVLSDDAFDRGVIEFADGSAHLLAESFVAAGAWTPSFATFAHDFSDGPIEVDVAIRNDDAQRSYRVLFVLEGELRANEIVISRVSENVRALPWALVRRYAGAPLASWHANTESQSRNVELEARNEADATALVSELAAHECTCERSGLRLTCRSSQGEAPFVALATALAARLPADTRASILVPR